MTTLGPFEPFGTAYPEKVEEPPPLGKLIDRKEINGVRYNVYENGRVPVETFGARRTVPHRNTNTKRA